jgi:CRP-like cAMP-binding protein
MSTTIPEDAWSRLRGQLTEILPKQVVDELIEHHTKVTYGKDSILFLQGAPADLMFWVLSGLVKVYCPLPDGNRTLVRLCGPGDIVGYADYLDVDGRRLQAFEAQALNKCTVALFTREHVAKVLQKLDQAKLVRLLENLNTAWSSIAHRLTAFLGYSFRRRLEITFRDLASRFGAEDARGILLPIKLSHSDLAEMIDGSRPMVTRLIGDMVAEQVLYRDGKRYFLASARSNKLAADGQANGNASGCLNGDASALQTNGKVNGQANPKVRDRLNGKLNARATSGQAGAATEPRAPTQRGSAMLPARVCRMRSFRPISERLNHGKRVPQSQPP